MARYRLVCFDVDGTLADNIEYSWQLFHNAFEVDEKRRIHARDRYFKGTITYSEWAEHDIGLWKEKGVGKEDFLRALRSAGVELMPGAMETLAALKAAGIKLAIISGTLNLIPEYLIPAYDEIFDDVFLSTLLFDDQGKLVKAHVTEYDMEGKAEALKLIAKREGIPLSECVFVGDHYNDVRIMQEAGLGIAFNCKSDELRKVASMEITKKDLREILPHIIPSP